MLYKSDTQKFKGYFSLKITNNRYLNHKKNVLQERRFKKGAKVNIEKSSLLKFLYGCFEKVY